MAVSLPLDVALQQCLRHAEVIKSVLAELPLQITAEQLRQRDPALTRALDQFIFRFTKLQDTLGVHVLRQFALEVLREPVDGEAFIDVLLLLEKRGLLDYAGWVNQRKLRNALTHEYPEDLERQANVLADGRLASRQLMAWLDVLVQRARTAPKP